MQSLITFIKTNSILRRWFLVVFSSLTVLTTAGSCSILPGLIPGGSKKAPTTIYGALKRDPSIRPEGFGRINTVLNLEGKEVSGGLSTAIGNQLVQMDTNTFYFLTTTQGLFRSTNAGRNWQRIYLFPVGSTQSDAQKKAQEINAQLAKNSTFLISSFVVDPSNSKTIFIGGLYNTLGKIYQSTDNGKTFKEIYSEINPNISIKFLTINPQKSSSIYAVLDGGALITSYNAGATWQKLKVLPGIPTQFGFIPEYENMFYALIGTLYISPDDGLTWKPQSLTKLVSKIGEAQPKDNVFDFNLFNKEQFGSIEKLAPVFGNRNDKHPWLLIADRQIWYSEDTADPFRKLVLPVQAEQYNALDVASDPKLGLDKIVTSINNRLFETRDRGVSWNVKDKISLANPIGNIGQIIIDPNNTEVIYLMLVNTSPLTKRVGKYG